MRAWFGLLLAMCAAQTLHAQPTTTLERVRAAGVLRCGGAIRPGLAYAGADGVWHGLLVEMCRAVAVAALDAGAKIDFHGYLSAQDFARASHADDVSFLTGSELFDNGLFGAVLPGPAVFYETTGVMVRGASTAQRIADLAGAIVCVEPGTGPERSLVAATQAGGIPIELSAWQETEEMMDAFDSGRCPAIAGETTALAALRLGRPQEPRILSEPLSVSPLMAVTGPADGAWSAIVAWTVHTVAAAEHPSEKLPVDVKKFGLDPGWQMRVTGVAGSYADMFARNLGAGSPLKLPRGVNASWQDGGLIAPARVE